ncbi:putative glutaredoxin [Radiomyces spectabilis]|uniref:putative glutaredoxin n=1 Tax=Radiomyces spectabilis TaxID=64574 RepID=UPI002220DEAC|nr:putative glutaredoxin [Radiomyces spectabilis]KAI8388426.1 putative glutaredoxin [Radiomyces spectabilis]
MTAAEIVDTAISRNKVMVFSKSYCPYCEDAKDLLSDLKVPFEVMELDERSDGDALQKALFQKTGQWTVPNIFIDEQHIGGCDDLESMHRVGQLEQVLISAKILMSST